MKKNILRNMLTAIAMLFTMMLALPQQAKAQVKEAYVVKSTDGKTLTFYYDSQKSSREGTVYGINDTQKEGGSIYPAWTGTFDNANTTVTTTVFDTSFKDYKPTSTKKWFYNLEALTNINGMKDNLNTTEVTNMRTMFYGCNALTSIDLSNFNTANVTDMASMFYYCAALTSLDLKNFNTENVTDMAFMFSDCTALTSLDLKNFNTAKVNDISYMFYFCTALTSIDLSNFNTENVADMRYMFYYCTALTSLDLSSFNTAKVTNMGSMFSDCTALTSLDLKNFNTENVTNMYNMFYKCNALTSLDLSSFNTAKVTTMEEIFYECTALTTIYCDDDWARSGINSNGMFSDCTQLKGAVPYDSGKVDIEMANPTTGYFTKTAATGIISPTIDIPAKKRGIHTLQGLKMQGSFDSLPAGIYIVDGRKVVKK